MSRMIIVDDVVQGTDQWHALRSLIPTASNFGSIATPTGRKSGAGWETYMNQLVAAMLTKKSTDGYKSDWMKRGNAMEDEAISTYEFIYGVEVSRPGFVYRDKRKDVGFSPDALTEKGGLELKCPSAPIHVGYLVAQEVPAVYRPQVYGSLHLSDRDYWDFMSYHPDMSELIVRVERDDRGYLAYAAALDKFLPIFIRDLNDRYNDLKAA